MGELTDENDVMIDEFIDVLLKAKEEHGNIKNRNSN